MIVIISFILKPVCTTILNLLSCAQATGNVGTTFIRYPQAEPVHLDKVTGILGRRNQSKKIALEANTEMPDMIN
jgi:hypothetical protein